MQGDNQDIIMTLLRTTAVAALLTMSGSAFAAMTPQEEAAFRQHCTGDYMRLCSAFDPDSPQVEQCFKDKAKDLSPRCSATIASYSKANPKGRR